MKKILITSAILLNGCATMVNGPSQEFVIDSEPAGAKIVMNDQYYGKTPLVVNERRNKVLMGRLKKEGYHDSSFVINKKFSKFIFLDALLWPSLIVDYMTGALWKFDKQRVYMELDHIKDKEKQTVIPIIIPNQTRYQPAPLPKSSPVKSSYNYNKSNPRQMARDIFRTSKTPEELGIRLDEYAGIKLTD